MFSQLYMLRDVKKEDLCKWYWLEKCMGRKSQGLF